jgi:hypothetical protein
VAVGSFLLDRRGVGGMVGRLPSGPKMGQVVPWVVSTMPKSPKLGAKMGKISFPWTADGGFRWGCFVLAASTWIKNGPTGAV